MSILVGTCISYFFYRKSKKEPRPVLFFDSLRLLGGRDHLLPDELQIRFADKSVSFLSRTVLTFFNTGTSLLDGATIVQADGPKIAFAADSEILKITKVKQTNGANGISLQHCGKYSWVAHLDFEYLDPQDGATFEILHTDPIGEVNCSGKLKGIPSGIRTISSKLTEISSLRLRRPRYPRQIFLAIFIIGVGSVFVSLLPHHPSVIQVNPAHFSRIFLTVAGLMYAIAGAAGLFLTRRRIPKSLLHK